MLVLTRKQNEQIQIGENVFLTVLRIKGNTVRLGIEAPADVRVVRGELPRQPKARCGEVTLMVTDPKSGEVSEKWNSRTDGMPRRDSSRRGREAGQNKEARELRTEINRLQEIVGRVTSSSWSFETPTSQS